MLFISEDELYKTISKNIKYYRKLAGKSQEELADLTGYSKSYISKIEAPNCDKPLSIAALNRISNALQTEIFLFFKQL